ncbi:MAG: hypothetical protein JWM19_2474, partial [Actinomycetia bacterium]|nr:hypothetical protein [Actinomycetes bacterium]
RIAAAEQSLASAYAGMRSAGVDPDSIATAFAVARDCLAEARELSAQARRELALAQYERDLARRRAPAAPYPPAGVPQPAAPPAYPVPPPSAPPAQPGSTVRPGSGAQAGSGAPAGSTASGPLAMPDAAPAAGRDWAMAMAARTAIPDLPGTDLCPDPGTARTPEEFMDALRGFRAWAGKPSFRAMERQCAHRFAASTMCTALRADTLPSLDMVHAIVAGCGGSPRHVHAFATACRRLSLPGHDDIPGQGGTRQQDTSWRRKDRPRGLHSVGGTGTRAALPGTTPSAAGEAADEGTA